MKMEQKVMSIYQQHWQHTYLANPILHHKRVACWLVSHSFLAVVMD